MKKVTLKTLAEATAQQVFDQVAKHLLEQGVRSMSEAPDEDEFCLYRGPEGLKCAAGCLISDNEYEDGMEGRGWRNLVNNGYASNAHIDIIDCLQSIHDKKEPSTWRKELLEISKRFDLNPLILEQ